MKASYEYRRRSSLLSNYLSSPPIALNSSLTAWLSIPARPPLCLHPRHDLLEFLLGEHPFQIMGEPLDLTDNGQSPVLRDFDAEPLRPDQQVVHTALLAHDDLGRGMAHELRADRKYGRRVVLVGISVPAGDDPRLDRIGLFADKGSMGRRLQAGKVHAQF